ncbi:hypothetical protein [Cellvibrio sp.]
MTDYIFTINLETEDPRPSYQISGFESLNQKYFCLPPNVMPKCFSENDTISFSLIGRLVLDCTLYIKPLNETSETVPFKVIKPTETLPFPAESWQIPLIREHIRQLDKVIIDSEEGDWDITVAGTFATVFSIDDDGGGVKFNKNKQPLDYASWIVMPFLVDPEVVVGRRN